MATTGNAFLRRHGFVLALVVLFLGLSAKYSRKALHDRGALNRWLPQIMAMENGQDISRRFNYPNPPIMAILLEPLTQLTPVVAALVWFYLKAAFAVVTLLWIFRLVETPEHPFPAWAKALTIVLSLRPIMGDLDHGNVNLFILFLIAAALTAYRRGLDFLAGCTLGLAIACKITPALFIPYFLWKKAGRLVAGCAAGLLLFLWPGLVPAARLGWQENQQQLASWYVVMVRPFVVEGKVWSEHNNQSLSGVVYRLATHSPSASTYIDDVYTPTRFDNLLEISPSAARLLVKACLAVFAVVLLWSCRTPTEPRAGWRLSAEFAVVVLGMLLFSERTWKHHCVTLVLPFAVLCYYLAVRASPWSRVPIAAALSLATGLMASTSTGTLVWPDELAVQAQVYGAYVAAYLVLLSTLVILLHRPDDRADAASVPSAASTKQAA